MRSPLSVRRGPSALRKGRAGASAPGGMIACTAGGAGCSAVLAEALPPPLARKRLLERAASLSWIRSEEHTSELQSLMRISYAVFCLKKKNKKKQLQT